MSRHSISILHQSAMQIELFLVYQVKVVVFLFALITVICTMTITEIVSASISLVFLISNEIVKML